MRSIINSKWIHLALLAAISSISIFWFKQDYINGGDFIFPMAPTDNVLANYYHIWTDKWGLGLVNSRAIPQLPMMALMTLAGWIGISTAISERILFYLIFFLSGAGMYILTTLMPFEKNKRTIGLLAALFFMFNPFNIIFYWHVLDGMIFVYAMLPALTAVYLYWFRTNKIIYPLIFFSLTFFGGYTFSNPLVIPILWAVILIFHLLINNGHDRKATIVLFFIKAGILWTLINGWWLVPLLGSITDEFSGLTATIGSTWDTLSAFSTHTSLLNLFRLSDLYWAFGSSTMGEPYYNYAAMYRSGLFTAISFLLPLIVFFPLTTYIVGKKQPHFVLWLYISTLFLLFLAKGNHEPFGTELYHFIFRLPLLSAFRAPIHKLGVLISMCYAVLFGYGMISLYHTLRKASTAIAIVISSFVGILILVIYPYPLWTGEVIHDGFNTYPSYHVNVPPYYGDAAEWLDKKDGHFRFYSVPQSPTFNISLKWENGYLGSNPSVNIFSKPGVYSTVNPIAQLPYILLRDNPGTDISSILRLQGVKYLLLHKDVNDELWDIFSGKHKNIAYIQKSLTQQAAIIPSEEFGMLQFYKLSDEVYLPPIYTSSMPTIIAGSGRDLEQFIASDYLNGHPALAFTTEQPASSIKQLIHNVKSQGAELVLANQSIKDLSINLAARLARSSRTNPSVSSEHPLLLLADSNGRATFNVINAGIYETWSKKISKTGAESATDKWHLLQTNSLDEGNQVLFEKRGIKILIVSAQQREQIQHSLEPHISGHLMYIDRFTAKEKSTSLDASGVTGVTDNPFRLQAQSVYIPYTGDYRIMATLKPVRAFLPQNKAISSGAIIFLPENTSGWAFKPEPARDRELQIHQAYDGLRVRPFVDIKKGITMEKEFHNIALRDYPYFAIMLTLADSDNIDIRIDIWMNDHKGKLLPNNLSFNTSMETFVVNIHDEALRQFTTTTVDRLQIGLVRITIKEKKGNQSPPQMLEGKYFFKLQNIAFMKKPPTWPSFNNGLPEFSPEKYFFNHNGTLKVVRFTDEVPATVETIYKIREDSFIDLKETPTLIFTIPNVIRHDNIEQQQRGYIITLSLDLTGDNRENHRITLQQNPTPLGPKYQFSIPALETITATMPGKNFYHLIGMNISYPNEPITSINPIASRKMIRYKEHRYTADYIPDYAPILRLDGDPITTQQSIKQAGNNETITLEFKTLLTAGIHKIEPTEHEKYTIETLEILPAKSSKTATDNFIPSIQFNKLSPTRYIVNVQKTNTPFTLVFSESFHAGWKAYINHGGEYPNTPIPLNWLDRWTKHTSLSILNDHFVVNGYANGWVIPDIGSDEEQTSDTIQIIIDFQPQRLVEAGIILSAIALFGFIGLRGLSKFRKSRRKSENEISK